MFDWKSVVNTIAPTTHSEDSMAVVELTDATIRKTIEENDTVIIDWWAEWCGPCKSFAPTFSAAAEKNPDIVFGKVDTEANADLSASAGIMSIPTLMVFRGGVLIFSQPGALPAASLDDLILQVREVDIEKLKDEAATQESAVAE
jgi:thioredoxin 1